MQNYKIYIIEESLKYVIKKDLKKLYTCVRCIYGHILKKLSTTKRRTTD